MVRKGFTLIELIVAIVVIAIAMMSIPLMLSQSSKLGEFSINQEVVLAGATKIGNILTYPWDDNLSNQNEIVRILDVSDGDDELGRSSSDNNRRVGNFQGNYRRKFYSTVRFASTIFGKHQNNPRSIDDFNATEVSLYNTVSSDTDYKKDINLSTKVFYINDKTSYSSSPVLSFDLNESEVTPSTNIKLIKVEVKDNIKNETIAVFKAFSANIGSYELLYRTF